MADINKVVLIGRLTRDAEQSYTQGGYALVKFSLAVNRRRKQGDRWIDEANYFDITSFGRQGEAIASFLAKGRQVAVEGQLRQDRWEAQDGSKRSKVYVESSYIQLLGNRRDNAPSEPYQAGEETNSVAPASQSINSDQPESRFEDDIPF